MLISLLDLQRGDVVEYGTHNELMLRQGLYYELVTAQREKEKEKEEEVDDEKDNAIEEALARQAAESATAKTRRMSLMLRRTSVVSVKSVTSEAGSESGNDIGANDQIEKQSRFRMPLILKVARLNSPEWFYLLHGGIASLVFGAIMPVCKHYRNRFYYYDELF